MTGQSAVEAYLPGKNGARHSYDDLALDPAPDVLVSNVSVHHPQLRDLLQPAGEKGKVLFINDRSVACADFNSMKAPSVCYSLDFKAVCLTTGSGFVAAGGESSELDVRPLPSSRDQSVTLDHVMEGSSRPPRASPSTSSLRPQHASELDAVVIDAASRHTEGRSSRRPASTISTSTRGPPHWHVRTPTGGSINNSIFIQPDVETAGPSTSARPSSREARPHPSTDDAEEYRHRGKRRREDNASRTTSNGRSSGDATKEYISDQVYHDERAQRAKAPYSAADLQGRLGWTPGKNGAIACPKSVYETPSWTGRGKVKARPVRLLISNNDQTVRVLRLRPPSHPPKKSAGPSETEEGLEAGMPGLSRTRTIKLPTSINHTSYSPDGRHIVSVGDTPEVFLFQVHADGSVHKIATYNASSDASFSTSWSPDSLQFAVASQDGIISVWDVRSSQKLASLQTTHRTYHYRPEAARVVKWSPRGDLLAYSEDTSFIHVVETRTFAVVQHIQMPTLSQVRTYDLSSAPCADNPTSRYDASAELDDIAMTLWGPEGSVPSENTAATGPFAHGSPTRGTASTTAATTTAMDPDWFGSTAPANFASGTRPNASSAIMSTLRPFVHGRRYRDIVHPGGRTALDRSLLADMMHARHSLRDLQERYVVTESSDSEPARRIAPPQDERAPMTSFASAHGQSSPSAPAPSTTSRLPSSPDYAPRIGGAGPASVEPFLSDLSDATERAALWGTPTMSITIPPGRRYAPGEETHISGMTWDPDGEYLYVSTDKLILRYKVRDLSFSSGSAALR